MRPLAVGLCALIVAAAPAALRAEDEAVKALLSKAAKAQGGADKAAMLGDLTLKGKAQIHEGNDNGELAMDLSVSGFDRLRGELTMSENGRSHMATVVIVGDKGWARDADANKVEEAPAEVMPTLQSMILAIRAPGAPGALAAQKAFTLAHGGEARVGDATAEVLRLSRKDRPDLTIYFDKTTGLPLKAEVTMKSFAGGEDKPFTFFYSDFKEFDGVKHFTKVKVSDEKVTVELELSEIKPGAKFEANTFDKP